MPEPEFVTAEHSTNPCRGIEIMLRTISREIDGAVRPVRFAVTTSTSYRATLPACLRDDCAQGKTISCTRKLDDRHQHSGMSVAVWLRHSRTHCHGWHLKRAESFRDAVARTYKRTGRN